MAGNLTEIQSQQLNPLTPMAFLTPDAGYQATIAAYVMVGSAGALIWDILSNVDSDFKLLFRRKIGFPTLGKRSCLRSPERDLSNCCVAELPSNKTNHNKFVVALFGVLWLSVLGTSLTVAPAANAVHIGPTNYCSATKFRQYASSAPITFAINDTFVFVAISWRLLFNATRERAELGLKSMVFGEYLPAFSRALLQDGQVYYLVSVTSNITLALITWVRPAVPIPYRFMYTILNVALTNIMACLVFRHTKLGVFTEDGSSLPLAASQLGPGQLELGVERWNTISPLQFVALEKSHVQTSGSDMESPDVIVDKVPRIDES
ncbi:hypothetical protein DXG01_003806 [Tephrocybe rancida]|nr:hypothetical protein DXG01_003806 [Tephrocybe rancida]